MNPYQWSDECISCQSKKPWSGRTLCDLCEMDRDDAVSRSDLNRKLNVIRAELFERLEEIRGLIPDRDTGLND